MMNVRTPEFIIQHSEFITCHVACHEPGADQCRLAKARRGADQRQPAVQAGVQPLDQTRTEHKA